MKSLFKFIIGALIPKEDIDLLVIHIHSFIRAKNGRIAHHNEFSGLLARLRRNLHKLEKGICHPSRKKTFAEYLVEPIISDLFKYKAVRGSDHFYQYAISVLTEYAQVSKLSQVPKEQINSILLSEKSLTKIERKWLQNESTLEGTMQNRRSTRVFSQDIIPTDELSSIINVALTSPSACNRQPFRVIASNRGTQRHLDLCNIPLGTSGWSEKIPTILFIIGDWSNVSNPRDHLVPITDGSLFAMQLMLVLTSKGLGSCPINWSDVSEKNRALEKLLELKPFEKCVMAMAVGYPLDHQTPISAKKKSNEVLSITEYPH